ncbi:Phosphoheptose isomerase [uncultured archaeon]|nr:Phosphoheptose isomerase [uncultured archaeon]
MEKSYDAYLKECITDSTKLKIGLFERTSEIEEIANEISECYRKGGKVLICGNGGSAADSQHIAGELVGRFKLERRALDARALTTDTSILTAWANDYNFDGIFARQVEAYAKKGDVLIGISTSGNSADVIKAFEKGRDIWTYNISFTGEGGGKLKELSNICFDVPSKDTPRIQEAHELVYHLICDLVEKKLFGK